MPAGISEQAALDDEMMVAGSRPVQGSGASHRPTRSLGPMSLEVTISYATTTRPDETTAEPRYITGSGASYDQARANAERQAQEGWTALAIRVNR